MGLELLKNGYTIRGTTRSSHSADALAKGAYAEFRDQVQFVVVEDITIQGAFDEAVRGEKPFSFFLMTLSCQFMKLKYQRDIFINFFFKTLSVH